MNKIYALLTLYYLLGLTGIAVINQQKRGDDAKERWIKFSVYVFITITLTSALLFVPPLAIALGILIVLIGGFELAALPSFKIISKVPLLLAYALLGILFCIFLARSSPNSNLPCRIYLIVLSFDGFSQLFGQLIGGRRLAPRISPAKTYSGFIGGMLMGIATAAFLEWTVAPEILFSTALICLLAFTGDMLASFIKRRAGIKDYSSLIPGHGGVLDRFDSFLFTGAMLECYFRLT